MNEKELRELDPVSLINHLLYQVTAAQTWLEVESTARLTQSQTLAPGVLAEIGDFTISARFRDPPEPSPVNSPTEGSNPGCEFAGPGRGPGSGDCEHFIGLPGRMAEPNPKFPGTDPTRDTWGKPGGWCWRCWYAYKLRVMTHFMNITQKAEAYDRIKSNELMPP